MWSKTEKRGGNSDIWIRWGLTVKAVSSSTNGFINCLAIKRGKWKKTTFQWSSIMASSHLAIENKINDMLKQLEFSHIFVFLNFKNNIEWSASWCHWLPSLLFQVLDRLVVLTGWYLAHSCCVTVCH